MSTTLVAVPSCAPGGIDAPVSEHFGHCDMFTLVEIDNGESRQSGLSPRRRPPTGRLHGVRRSFGQHGVKILIAGGMGMRPLLGFGQVGVDVYKNGGAAKLAKRSRRSWMEA